MKRSRPTGLLVLLNGSTPGGYSGGDLHAVAVVNRWAAKIEAEVFHPRHTSGALLALIDPVVRRRSRRGAPPERSTMLRPLVGRYAVRTISAAVRLFGTSNSQVVVAASHFPFDLVPVAFGRGAALRVVYWHHHATSEAHRPLALQWLIAAAEESSVALVRRRGFRVLTSSQATRAHLIERGVPPEHVKMTTNAPASGVLPTACATMGSNPPPPPSAPFLLFCGRLAPQKGTADLRAITRLLRRRGVETPIVICGDGPDRERLQRDLLSDPSAGDVRVLGFVTEEEKRHLFASAHVLMFPSREEGWGITVGEALGAGCHVVAYDLPAVRAAYPEGPVYVSVGDVERFAEAVSRQLEAPSAMAEGDAVAEWDAIADGDIGAITEWLNERPAVGSVLVVAHTWVEHSAHYLVNLLAEVYPRVVYIELPFSHASKPYARLTEYRNGKPRRRWRSVVRTPPGVPGYGLDVAHLYWWIGRLRQRFDLAVAFDCANTMACLGLRRLGVIRCLAFYSVDFAPHRFASAPLNRLYLRVEKLAAERADVSWVGGRIPRARRLEAGIRDDRAAPEVVVSAGSRVTESEPPPFDAPVIGFVGHLLEKQGLQLVIAALPRIRRTFPGARMRVIGDGPFEDELRKLAECAGVAASIDWLGRIDHQARMLDELSRCSIGVAPYRPDPMSFSKYAEGGKIRDYLACGLPVVATDVTTLANVVRRELCGYVVDYDGDRFASAILTLLSDRGVWKRMRARAFSVARGYDWDMIHARALSESLSLLGYRVPTSLVERMEVTKEPGHCASA